MSHKSNTSPLFNSTISCGLFGISDDYIETHLSLDEKFRASSPTTFYVRASGDSMSPLIMENDILVVDTSIPVKTGDTVACSLNSNPLCKKILMKNDTIQLISLNESYPPQILKEEDEFRIFGLVKGIVRDLS